MSLFKLPKEMLIEIMTKIPHDTKNDDRMLRALCGNFVQKHTCSVYKCLETCMSIHHPSNSDAIQAIINDDELKWDNGDMIFFAYPHLKEIYKLDQIIPQPPIPDILNKTGSISICCKMWYCGKHWRNLYDDDGDITCPNSGGG